MTLTQSQRPQFARIQGDPEDNAALVAYIASVAGGLSDGDKGVIVVSSSGTVWSFDTNVVTTAALTVLDDTTVGAMRTTLGSAALTSNSQVVSVGSINFWDASATVPAYVQMIIDDGTPYIDGIQIVTVPALLVGLADYANLSGAIFIGDVEVPDDAYDATTWDGSNTVPTKDAIRDKIETLGTSAYVTLGANVGTFLATPSSANLAAAVTGETGSGALVFATSPTFVTPLLGTPTSGVLTNCTGLPVAGGGTGVATLTAYAPVFGGTTGTGAVQSGTAGTSGHVLTSNGAGVLPTFQAAGGGTPTVITVADTADSTCFVALFESATGDLAPKTDGGLLYNASTGALTVSGDVTMGDNRWHPSANTIFLEYQTQNGFGFEFINNWASAGVNVLNSSSRPLYIQTNGLATVFGGAVTIGSGTAISKVLSATATLNYASIAAQGYEDLTITVTGAATGDTVSVGIPNGSMTADLVIFGWVSAADTVTIRVANIAIVTARDPASGTWRATVTKF